MKFKRQLCRPCAEAMRETHNVEQVEFGRNVKVNCEECKRRKFGHTYMVEEKKAVIK